MIYIKTFETFINDDNRGEGTKYPKHNQVLNQEATEYVDTILNSNQYEKILDMLNVKIPDNISGEDLDKFMDEVRQKAIQHFIDNPDQLKKDHLNIKTFPVGNGNLVPTTNNIGGALREQL